VPIESLGTTNATGYSLFLAYKKQHMTCVFSLKSRL
jgi:hypothetical protein